jgi:flagellin
VNSILNNSASLSALQALNMTQQSLATTQSQVSTGLKVASAADNAAYWSIGTQLSSDSGIVTATNDALSQSEAVLSTATSAINSVITTINSIQTALTEATNPGADITDINTTLTSLSKQLTDAVNGASFNGLNILNGTQTSQLNFVSGFNASATGGSYNTISFNAQALTGGVSATATTQTIQEPNVTESTFISELKAMTSNGVTAANASYDNNSIVVAANVVTITAVDQNGIKTSTAYTGIDATGAAAASNGAAVGFTVATTKTIPAGAPTGLLSQTGTTTLANNYDLTNIGSGVGATAVTSANAADMLSAVGVALAAVTGYSASIGATQNRMTTANTFNTAVTTDYSNGIAGLVDADMNQASTRLQALQTQEQLGIQSLSIANQNAQLILKLFQ